MRPPKAWVNRLEGNLRRGLVLLGVGVGLLALAQPPYCYGCHTYSASQLRPPSPLEAPAPKLKGAELPPKALERAWRRYAELCAGCHGGLREGAIGRPLLPEEMAQKGLPYLEAVIAGGLPGGMPDYRGRLSPEEIRELARFLTYPQLLPPELSLKEIAAHTRLLVPPEARPKAPERPGVEDTFGVVLRDAGRIAFLDGRTRERLALFDLRAEGEGGWPHQLHVSAQGRYFLVPGQDGNVWLVDLWFKTPRIVAQTRACYEARAAEFSKAPGFEDRYILVGCYTPPQLVVLDGATLSPLRVIPLKLASPEGEALPRARQGYISGSKRFPVWVVQMKDAAETWIVDYSRLEAGDLRIDRLQVKGVPALHDGGWLRLQGPEDQRYAMAVSFPQGDQIVAIDVQERRVAAVIPTGAQVLHAGRGVNLDHPVYGHLWATTAAGGELVVVGADPSRPEYLWKVVKKVKLPYPGSLYGKTHPNSPWILVDFTKSDDPKARASLCAIDKLRLEVARCFEVPGARALEARLVQPEFNREGTEFWIAAWTNRLTPGFIAIYDAKTLEPRGRIGGADFLSPLSKFNAYNTANYVY